MVVVTQASGAAGRATGRPRTTSLTRSMASAGLCASTAETTTEAARRARIAQQNALRAREVHDDARPRRRERGAQRRGLGHAGQGERQLEMEEWARAARGGGHGGRISGGNGGGGGGEEKGSKCREVGEGVENERERRLCSGEG